MLDVAQQVKEKIDVVDFLSKYLKLTPAGKNFRAVCPFHKEKTPSLMVSPDKQIWHCFGCGSGGDVIKFLMLFENLEFFDALKVLAEKAGMNLDVLGGRDFKTYDVIYKAMEAAKEFYRTNLYKSDEVKDYLKDRGLKGETVKEFELGVALDEPDAISRHLLKKGFSITDIEKAGLVFKTERGTYWDRFRGRLMFPLYNHVGKVVAFTGRLLPGRDDTKTGKYVNSPETPIFQKSKILYGFHKTKNDIREARSAILVEGQMDFLMMWQDGVRNVVATSGTALTPEHLKTLKKLTDDLVLSFDSDAAGQAAAEKSIDLASSLDFMVKLLIIEDPKLKDPADVVKEKPGAIAELLKNAKPAMEYYFYKYITKNGEVLDLKKNKQNLKIVLSKIKNLASSIEKNHWVKKLSDISKISESVLMEEMENIKETQALNSTKEDPLEESETEFSRRDLICQRLIGLAMNDKDVKEKLGGYLEYFSEFYKDLYSGKKLEGSLEKVAELISLRFSFENTNLKEDDLKKEFEQLVHELKLNYLKEKQAQLGREADELEAADKESEWEAKAREHKAVTEEIHALKGKNA
ncbi:MAG: DNA primase [bacterium]|nr:DNA primase [bacterium]